MADGIEQIAQGIADALAPTPAAPSAQWRWGTVKAVTEYGTMNVEVGGSILYGVRAAQHCTSAKVGDRVRVSYYGTEALVDAIRATASEQPLILFREATSESVSIAEGGMAHITIQCPTVEGYTCKGAMQMWHSTSAGSGNVILGFPYRSSADNVLHVPARANSASTITVTAYLLYLKD